MIQHSCFVIYHYQMVKKGGRKQPYQKQNPDRRSLRQVILDTRHEADQPAEPEPMPSTSTATHIFTNDTDRPVIPADTPAPEPARPARTPRAQKAQSGPSMQQFNDLQSSVASMSSVLKSMKTSLDKMSSNKSKSNTPVFDDDSLNDRIETHAVITEENSHMRFTNVPVSQTVRYMNKNDNVDMNDDDIINVDEVMHDAVGEHIEGLVEEGYTTIEPGNFKQIGRPVDLKIPDSIKQKIWSDQYVEFENLIDIPIPKTPSGLEMVGNRLVSTKPIRQITSLGQWCDAMVVYLTVYSRKYPHATPELTAYLQTIKHMCQKGGDYLTYDREFRYMRQYGSKSWELNSTLWMECRDQQKNGSNRSDGSSKPKNNNQGGGNFRPPQGSKPVPQGFCFAFHGKVFSS